MDSAPVGLRSASLYVGAVFILLGIVSGGLFLSKQRQAYYNTISYSPSAVTPSTANVGSQPIPTNNNSSRSTPNSSKESDNSVAPNQPANSSAPVGSMAPQMVPDTGSPILELALTDVLIVIAAYLAIYIVRTKPLFKKT